MYEYIKGEVTLLEINRVVIECMGIGYILNISLQSHQELSSLEDEAEAKIYIHQYQVRDDLPIMFGFCTRSERELFRMLIGVSGVGGNTACNVLSTFSTADLQAIISTGDSLSLKRVKGLGQKSAEKIIVELRDKIIKVDLSTSPSSETTTSVSNPVYDEALAALTMLGFSKSASAKALDGVIAQMPKAKVEDIIRMTLKKL